MQKKDEKQESTHEESPESDGEEVVEKNPIVTARDPGSPTQEEIDEHNITYSFAAPQLVPHLHEGEGKRRCS